LGARGEDYVIPQQTEGDTDAETGAETIGRIPMDRADSVEDIDFPHMQDKRDHHTKGRLATLVVPTSLQMGWVESPPYFCAATETSRDISTEYIETEVN
jgi:hypothetical protein